MEGIRVNKITVNIDTENSYTTISLYRTNQLLGTVTDEDLDIKSFREAGVSVKAYQLYCKDVVVNLLDNGGIPGYYYEPKSDGESIKYDMSGFRRRCEEYITGVIGGDYEFIMTQNDIEQLMDKYKDKYIKDAIVDFEVLLKQYNIRFKVRAEIKSGQACRPKIFIHNDGTEDNFNITNINRMVKDNR